MTTDRAAHVESENSLRKPGKGMAILALALLVAITTSTNSVINYINARSEVLAGLVQIGF